MIIELKPLREKKIPYRYETGSQVSQILSPDEGSALSEIEGERGLGGNLLKH